jgi:uncharacterized protein YjfI (DUF2170 family)
VKNAQKRNDRKNIGSNEASRKDQKHCYIVPKSVSLDFALDNVHHGKTSLTDNLAALAGMISEKVAADVETGMLTWIDERSFDPLTRA